MFLHCLTHLSISDKRDESLNPLAKGLLSIFNLVICKERKETVFIFYPLVSICYVGNSCFYVVIIKIHL